MTNETNIYNDLTSWGRAGWNARFHNMDGETPVRLTTEAKEQWTKGYRLASEVVASRGAL